MAPRSWPVPELVGLPPPRIGMLRADATDARVARARVERMLDFIIDESEGGRRTSVVTDERRESRTGM